MAIVLCGGTIVTATDCYKAELRIEDDKIVAIGSQVKQADDRILNVDGCLLLPGGVDAHTHFDLPVGNTVTADDFRSGTRAAILGGTTTIIDFATQSKGETLATAFNNWQRKADSKCYTDYGFHMAITDWNESVRREIPELVTRHGVVSYKLYMAYKQSLQVDDGVILQALQTAKECGALVCLHCENGDIVEYLVKHAIDQGNVEPCYHPLTRPVTAEHEAVVRALALAEVSQAPLYIVHLSSSAGLAEVVAAKQRGVEAYAETCPHYLLLEESCYNTADFNSAKYVMSPPLRSSQHQDALWQGLADESIDTVATDHCSFNFKGQKELGKLDFSKIPNGIPGVETRMALLYTYGVATGKLNLNQFVALTSTQPAKLFGLYPRKGTLAVGSDADILVWDPEYTSSITAQKLHHNCDYTPFEGLTQQGRPLHVFLRGQHIVRDSELSTDCPQGIYLARKPFPQRKVVGYVNDRP